LLPDGAMAFKTGDLALLQTPARANARHIPIPLQSIRLTRINCAEADRVGHASFCELRLHERAAFGNPVKVYVEHSRLQLLIRLRHALSFRCLLCAMRPVIGRGTGLHMRLPRDFTRIKDLDQ